MGNKFKFNQKNQSAQQRQTQQAPPAPPAPPAEDDIKKTTPKDGVPLSQVDGIDERMEAMKDAVLENFAGIRPWPNREGGMSATIRLKALSDEELDGYANMAEVAEEILQTLKDSRTDTDIPIYFDCEVTYDRNKRAQARIIKANPDENNLIAVLSIEYGVSNVKGGFVQGKVAQQHQEAPVEKPVKKYAFSKAG